MRKRIVCILLVALNILFDIIAVRISSKFYNGTYQLMTFVRLGELVIFISAMSFFNAKIRFLDAERSINVHRFLLVICSIITISIYILFLIFLPKYTVQEAYSIIKADPRFESSEIIRTREACRLEKHNNPFCEFGYTFFSNIDLSSRKRILFNPNNGSIHIFTEPIESKGD